jgi:hypothetical protein
MGRAAGFASQAESSARGWRGRGRRRTTREQNLSANKKPRASGIFEKPAAKAIDITVSANRLATNKPGLNPYALRNDILLDEEKARVSAENGVAATRKPRRPPRPYTRYDDGGLTKTDKGYSAAQLKADAEREGANHRRTLDRNLGRAGFVRVPDVCAHHIVASGHPDAAGSRKMLYTWSISINDSDNGVFLPGKRGVEVPTLKDAVQHDDLHADERYYLLVERRLMLADQAVQQSGRNALREMRGEMVRGTFPVARG